MTFDLTVCKIVLFITSESQITMASPLEICELVEQLICDPIGFPLVWSAQGKARNLMAMTSKKMC